MRHNWLRDSLAKLMKNTNCKDIQLEPSLFPVKNYQLPKLVEQYLGTKLVWISQQDLYRMCCKEHLV